MPDPAKTPLRRQEGALFRRWWDNLHDAHLGDRGQAAKLRRLDCIDGPNGRVPDVASAFAIPRFCDLWRDIKALRGNISVEEENDLMIVAYVLAHIRDDDVQHRHTAAALRGDGEESAKMKENSFVRLMRADTAGDLFDQTRRLTALLGRKAPIEDLAVSLFHWRRDPGIRRDWARAYYRLDLFGGEASQTEPTVTGA